jgi:hypothetical protein
MKAKAWLSEWKTAGTEFPRAPANDHNLALAVLIALQATVAAVFFLIGRLV